MGYTLLYIAFGCVALWLLSEVLLQHRARLRWRLLALGGFLCVALGVTLSQVIVIVLGAVGFGVGQALVTLAHRRGDTTGWVLGGAPRPGRRRRAARPAGAGPSRRKAARSEAAAAGSDERPAGEPSAGRAERATPDDPAGEAAAGEYGQDAGAPDDAGAAGSEGGAALQPPAAAVTDGPGYPGYQEEFAGYPGYGDHTGWAGWDDTSGWSGYQDTAAFPAAPGGDGYGYPAGRSDGTAGAPGGFEEYGEYAAADLTGGRSAPWPAGAAGYDDPYGVLADDDVFAKGARSLQGATEAGGRLDPPADSGGEAGYPDYGGGPAPSHGYDLYDAYGYHQPPPDAAARQHPGYPYDSRQETVPDAEETWAAEEPYGPPPTIPQQATPEQRHTDEPSHQPYGY